MVDPVAAPEGVRDSEVLAVPVPELAVGSAALAGPEVGQAWVVAQEPAVRVALVVVLEAWQAAEESAAQVALAAEVPESVVEARAEREKLHPENG